MQSFNEIREDFLSYANSQNLEGVSIEKLCNLLAYSAYKNQVLQAKHSLEESFSTASSLNSRLHHAANYQYSVPRGKCPVLDVQNILSLQTKTYNHLDYIMPFNGYYFYIDLSDEGYTKEVSLSSPVDGGIKLLCSSYPKRQTSTVETSDGIYFIDFVEAESVSKDFLLYNVDSSGTKSLVDPNKITEDSSLFYYKEKYGEEYKYAYDYLVLTIPSYGIRVVRHSDTTSWEASGMSLEFIPYNETTPDFADLRTITGFTLIEDSVAKVYTTLDVIPFEPRLENLDEIYANAVASYLQQGSVATPEDLVVALKKYNSQGYYRIYIDKRVNYDPNGNPQYTVSYDGTCSTIVYYGTTEVSYQDIQTVCVNGFKQSFSVTSDLVVVPAQAKNMADVPAVTGEPVRLGVVAYSDTKVLTNDALANLVETYKTRIGEDFNHSQFEADLVKMGFDYVKVYDSKNAQYSEFGGETDFNITCDIYQYPSIEARVKE